MKFVKGFLVGGIATASVLMMWGDKAPKKMMKQGKKWMKMMGM